MQVNKHTGGVAALARIVAEIIQRCMRIHAGNTGTLCTEGKLSSLTQINTRDYQ